MCQQLPPPPPAAMLLALPFPAHSSGAPCLAFPLPQSADDPLSYMAVDSAGRLVIFTQVIIAPSSNVVNAATPADSGRFLPSTPALTLQTGPLQGSVVTPGGTTVYQVLAVGGGRCLQPCTT